MVPAKARGGWLDFAGGLSLPDGWASGVVRASGLVLPSELAAAAVSGAVPPGADGIGGARPSMVPRKFRGAVAGLAAAAGGAAAVGGGAAASGGAPAAGGGAAIAAAGGEAAAPGGGAGAAAA
ncbi:MAG TPA: hypothetical protein VIW29_01035, partial [Polyangiaceae bacterium]